MIFSRLIEGKSAVDAFIRENQRLRGPTREVKDRVCEILHRVRTAEDRFACLVEYARFFDAVDATDFDLFVTPDELASAQIAPSLHDAIRESIRRVRAFHAEQLAVLTKGMRRRGWGYEWTMPADGKESIGYLGQRLLPMSFVGVYAPGGKAAYPSSVIMNAVPAEVAGVDRIVLATPARADGGLPASVLVTARELGIEKVLKVGGAAAIAALAFGVGPSFPPCSVVAGPGNRYVNEAKRQLWGMVGLDMQAGPSEVAVLVDRSTDTAFAAADLLTQVEHADDNVATLVALDRGTLDSVLGEVDRQLTGAPREAIMRRALRGHGVGVVCESEEEAAEVINACAPEHVSLLNQDPEGTLDIVRNAGSVLLGPYSAQSAGDYAAGPSHTLPTGGAARFFSPVNVMTFMRLSSLTHLEATDLMELLPTIECFGEMEGLPAHARDAKIRMRD